MVAMAARADLKSDAAREKKPCMVLCVGGDWCVSGEKVRGVYDSAAFRKALDGRWLFGVRDAREAPPPAAVSNENARVKSLDTATSRYPALILFNSRGEGVGRMENIPHDITAAELVRQVQACDAVHAKAEAAFAAGRRGEGFDLLRAQTPNLFRRERNGTWSATAYADEWKAMRAADPDDREGWALHFTMGDGIGDVAKATSLAEKPEEGEAFIAELRRRPMKHLTVEQRQSIDMAEFAFLRKRPEKKERARELLHAVYKSGPGTLWGWAAQGYLNDAEFGESVPPASTNMAAAVKYGKGIVDMPIKSHVTATKPVPPGAAAKLYTKVRRELVPAFSKRGAFSSVERRALARTWAIREIGTNTLQSVLGFEGGRVFANKFLQDDEWLEDFFASGPVEAPAAAFTNLFELVWNDSGGEILAGGLARRVATAIALNTSAKSEPAHFVRSYAAYMFLARAGRLHKSAYGQSVREWRFAVGRITGAADLLYFNQHFNYLTDDYGGALNAVPYRLHNCFGESIHGPKYYRPWRDCDWPGWSLRRALHLRRALRERSRPHGDDRRAARPLRLQPPPRERTLEHPQLRWQIHNRALLLLGSRFHVSRRDRTIVCRSRIAAAGGPPHVDGATRRRQRRVFIRSGGLASSCGEGAAEVPWRMARILRVAGALQCRRRSHFGFHACVRTCNA